LRRQPDDFGDEPLVLVYIARKLREALALEELLTSSGVDYLVEVDQYSGGLIFRSQRAGAFFYVRETEHDSVAELLRDHQYRPPQD
jgi:hypothetical protein